MKAHPKEPATQPEGAPIRDCTDCGQEIRLKAERATPAAGPSDSAAVREALRKLAEELDEVSEALYTTNALRGRQLKKCVGKVNGIFAALASTPAQLRERREQAISEAIAESQEAAPAQRDAGEGKWWERYTEEEVGKILATVAACDAGGKVREIEIRLDEARMSPHEGDCTTLKRSGKPCDCARGKRLTELEAAILAAAPAPTPAPLTERQLKSEWGVLRCPFCLASMLPPAEPVVPEREPLTVGNVVGVLLNEGISLEGDFATTKRIVRDLNAIVLAAVPRAALEPITDANPDVREIAFDFVGDLGLPEHRSKEWLGPRTERLVKRIVEVVNKYRMAPRAAGGQRETQAINLAMAEGVLDEIRSQFAKRHPVESLFFEQWLTETFGAKNDAAI